MCVLEAFVVAGKELLDEFVDELSDEDEDEEDAVDEDEDDPELEEELDPDDDLDNVSSSGFNRELTGAILLGGTPSPQHIFDPKGQLQ